MKLGATAGRVGLLAETQFALRQTVYPIVNVLAAVVMVFSITMLVPLALALIRHDDGMPGLVTSAAVCFGGGVAVWLATRRYRREMRIRDGIMLVVLAWSILPAAGALPLMLDGRGMSFTDAFFETASGLTTTGATAISGIDALAPSINFWRHLTNWIGGMGIIVLTVAILPLLGVGGMQLFKAETPGPMKDTKLTPRIASTAKALWLVYLGFTVACAVGLRLAGMNWFDAICHAFSVMALGGFSTHDASVGFFDSVPIELVLIVFHVVAAMNFAVHFLAVRGRSVRPYVRDSETRAILALLAVSCTGAALYLWLAGTYADFWTALRYASFNLITIATDCGYSSTDFGQWPMFVPMLMLLLSCITCAAGSTGGGIKMIRTLVLVRLSGREFLRLLHPSAVLPLRIGDQVIRNDIAFAVLAFTFLYFVSVVASTFALLLTGLDFISAFSAVIACINNAGPGLGEVGPATNYGGLDDVQTWILSFVMILGRLEIFTVVALFTPAFWRK
jgi:trk system potassium uptake protein TrkH